MIGFFLAALLAALSCVASHSNHQAMETLMDNVLVLMVPDGEEVSQNVTLTCGDAYQNQPVFWRKNGYDFQPPLKGNKVDILLQQIDGGNYTCHHASDKQQLNHTMVLIQRSPSNRLIILENTPAEGHIRCSAPNYRGSFRCTWKRTATRPNANVLLVKAQRGSESIPCQLDADGSGINCQDGNCSYKEEQQRIILTVHIYSFSLLETYTKAFYLRDIVRPEKIPNLRKNETLFSWSYPDSWDKPCSFFGLHFQVKLVKQHQSCDSQEVESTTTEQTTYTVIGQTTKYKVKGRNKKYVFCVRAQDNTTFGLWSDWSKCIVTGDRCESSTN